MNSTLSVSNSLKALPLNVKYSITLSDEDIIKKFKLTQDGTLLSPLFKKYQEKLFGLAYYYLSDRDIALDSVMDSFEVVLKSINEKEVTYFKGWVMSICRNICLKKLRDTKKFSELTEKADIFVEYAEDPVYNNDNIELMLSLIPQLKDKQKICIEAFYLKNQSYEDISSSENMTFKEVKSHIQNGKRKLRIMFEQNSKGVLNG